MVWLSGTSDDEDLIDDAGSDSHILGELELTPCRHRFLPLHRRGIRSATLG
jgi:hypothetical protein